ncbi:hypothetical protein N7468_000276 [Penicillium chermesinum]|uniref:Uncharacterized protein n=1 Tax=Penicillium chermesinum TaxID=63820 RepID=A0A9W9TZ48_9EURO|nr:uncharacterized protein N7468_000276 [Penicillium chermesinum]KAJ5248825.1 hypothetical protein N7468_000276 [Penicillium chermesinum]KAJ6150926.1 hypothetical protein N7470_007520 [Penicillium chermesinum]
MVTVQVNTKLGDILQFGSEISPDKVVTCFGNTKTFSRCRHPLSQRKTMLAHRILGERIIFPEFEEGTIQKTVEELASLCICGKVHESEKIRLAKKWSKDVKAYIDETSQAPQVEHRASGTEEVLQSEGSSLAAVGRSGSEDVAMLNSTIEDLNTDLQRVSLSPRMGSEPDFPRPVDLAEATEEEPSAMQIDSTHVMEDDETQQTSPMPDLPLFNAVRTIVHYSQLICSALQLEYGPALLLDTEGQTRQCSVLGVKFLMVLEPESFIGGILQSPFAPLVLFVVLYPLGMYLLGSSLAYFVVMLLMLQKGQNPGWIGHGQCERKRI